MNRDELHPLLEELIVDVGRGKHLRVSHIDSSVLKSFISDEVELEIKAANYIMRNQTKSTIFLRPPFYSATKSILTELWKEYTPYMVHKLSYQRLRAVKLQGRADYSQSAKQFF